MNSYYDYFQWHSASDTVVIVNVFLFIPPWSGRNILEVPCNRATSNYYCACVGINIVFIWLMYGPYEFDYYYCFVVAVFVVVTMIMTMMTMKTTSTTITNITLEQIGWNLLWFKIWCKTLFFEFHYTDKRVNSMVIPLNIQMGHEN